MRFVHVRCLGAAVALGILFTSPEVWQRPRVLIDLSAHVERCEPWVEVDASQQVSCSKAKIKLQIRTLSLPLDRVATSMLPKPDADYDVVQTTCGRAKDLTPMMKRFQRIDHAWAGHWRLKEIVSGETDEDGFAPSHLLGMSQGKTWIGKHVNLDFPLSSRTTPTLLANGDIHLLVEATVRNADRRRFEEPGTPGPPSRYLREFTVKVSQTVASGETLVIGGLRQTAYRGRIHRWPLIRWYPRIHDLVETKHEGLFDEEVLFLVTPELAP